jgi:hypothetical protein
MQATFKPGDPVPCNGIYKVRHVQHRLDHSVTILKNERFPVCRRCGDRVTFTLERTVSESNAVHGNFQVVLQEYSAWEQGGGPSIAA